MRRTGTIRGVLCVVLVCSTIVSAFIPPVCACEQATGRGSEAPAQRPASMTPASTPRLQPCSRPCCSMDRPSAKCCCRNGRPAESESKQEPHSAPARDCHGCNCSADIPALPPSDSKLSRSESSDLAEPAWTPQFAVLLFNPASRSLTAREYRSAVDLVVRLSRRTC